MAGTAALTAAVTLGLLRQWMWGAESLAEVLSGFTMFFLVLFFLLLIPAPRKLLQSLLSSTPTHSHQHHHHHVHPRPTRARPPPTPQVTPTPQVKQEQQLQPPPPPLPDTLPDPSQDGRKVVLHDVGKVFITLNLAQCGLAWPSPVLQTLAGSSAWGSWRPSLGLKGTICHFWMSKTTVSADYATVFPSRVSYNPTTFVVVRVEEGGRSKFIVADLEGLLPDDGCKEPLVLPRDGDVQGRVKSSGIV